jgi:hypothetical protein
MAICVHFVPKAMNAGQYNQAVTLLDEKGLGKPAGRLYHVCFGDGDKLQIFDIWESRPEWDIFSQSVATVSQQVGVEVASIDIEPVHNIIQP